MKIYRNRYAFLLVIIINLMLLVFPLFVNTPLNSLLNKETIINFYQRLFGVLAFVLLFYQILLGSFQDWFIKQIGGIAFKIHKWLGIGAYTIIFLHGLSYSLLGNEITGNFKVFLFKSGVYNAREEFNVLLGRVAFVLVTVTLITALLRTKLLLRWVWKRIHLINYVVFPFIALHMHDFGTDVETGPFEVISKLMYFTFASVVGYKVYKYLKN